tara:strand:- start:363 stop:1046 length:684 start_codon:yes stop_codon:yes gene_type:complete
MNLKGELHKMSITDLRGVCRELGLSCPKSKSGIIKRLLEPLKKGYKMEQIINIEDLTNPSKKGPAPLTFNKKDLKNLVVINKKFYNSFKKQLKKYKKLYRILKKAESLNHISMYPHGIRRWETIPAIIDGRYGIQGHRITTQNDRTQTFEVSLPGRGIVRLLIDENNDAHILDASYAIGNQKLLSNRGSTRSDYMHKYRGPTDIYKKKSIHDSKAGRVTRRPPPGFL